MQFVLVRHENGTWGWHLKSADDVVAVSTITYPDPQAVLSAVDEVKMGMGSAILPEKG